MGKDCNVPSIPFIPIIPNMSTGGSFMYIYVLIYICHHLVIYFRTKLLPMKLMEGAFGAGSFQDGLLALCARNPGTGCWKFWAPGKDGTTHGKGRGGTKMGRC
jgi:hypothetical protein